MIALFRRPPMPRLGAILAVAVAAGPPVALAQPADDRQLRADETFEDQVTVLEIEVPVQVFDETGEPVRGLTRDDFEVRYRGEVRPIVDFEAVDLSLERTAGSAAARGISRVDPSAQRALLLLFDFTYQSRGLLARALAEARSIVSGERLHPSDRAAVVILGGRQGARILTGFSRDRGRTLAALDLVQALADADAGRQKQLIAELTAGAPGTAEGIAAEYGVSASVAFGDGLSAVSITAGPQVGIEGAVAAGEALDAGAQNASGIAEAFEIGETLSRFATFQDVSFYAEALGNLGTLLSGVEGQKYALLFSQGPPASALEGYAGDSAPEGTAMVAAAMERAFGQLVRAGWEIHALGQGPRLAAVGAGGGQIDALGGGPAVDAPAGASTDGGSALFYMAQGTGGRAYLNRREPPLQTFLEQTAVSYVLRFQVEGIRPKAGKEAFEVLLTGPDIDAELRYRDFFYAPKPRSQMNDVELQIAEAETRLRDQRGRQTRNLEFTAHAFLDPGELGRGWLSVHLPAIALARELEELDGGDASRLVVVAGVADGSGEPRVALNQEVRLEEASLRTAPTHGLTFVAPLDLGDDPSGGARVQLAVELGARGARWSVPLQAWSGAEAFIGPIFLPTGLERLILRADGEDGEPVTLPLVTPSGGELVPLPFADVGAGDQLGVVLLSLEASHDPGAGLSLPVLRLDGEAVGSVALEIRGEMDDLVLWFGSLDVVALEAGVYRLGAPAGADWNGLGHFRVAP